MILIVNFIVAMFIVTAVHGVSHLIISRYYGFDIYHFVVGPLGFKKTNKGIKFYLENNLYLWSGVCTSSGDDVYNYSKVIISGPIANLVFGILFLLFYIYNPKNLLLIIGITSILLSIKCLLPMKKGLFYNDGGRWLNIRNNASERDLERIILNITKSYYSNGDYSKIDIDEIQILIDSEVPRLMYIGHYYIMKYYYDNYYYEEVDRQRGYMQKLGYKLPKNYTNYLIKM